MEKLQKTFTIFALVWLLQMQHGVSAEGKDNKGTEFIFGFMENIGESSLEIFVTTDELKSVEVNISTPLYNHTFVRTVHVSYGQVRKIVLDNKIRGQGTEIGNKSIYLRSNREVAVYAVNKHNYSTGAYAVFPLDVLGTNYFLLSWKYKSELMIIATKDNTIVRINLRNSGIIYYRNVNYTSGKTLILHMNKFQTFHAYDEHNDFSGVSIQSNFAITVLSGNRCITIGKGGCDHTVSQMTAIETYGREFVTLDMPNCLKTNHFRVLASEPRTSVNISGQPSLYLPTAGDIKEFSVTNMTSQFVSADKPVIIAFFTEGQCDDIGKGDPIMVLIPPLRQYATEYTFATVNVSSNPFRNSLTIVIPVMDIPGLIIDGNYVSHRHWKNVDGRADLKKRHFAVSDGGHMIYHDNATVTFLAISSGISKYNSYGYSTGQRLALINTVCMRSNSTPGDIIDNDCDGFIDEEIKDGLDNDGDGLIDEDLASHFCAPRRANDIFRCNSNPCMHMGTCDECRSFWKCDCLTGYTGDQCETEIDECVSSPCLHGGKCVDLFNEYKCHCLEGFTGVNCKTDINECVEDHCHNNGTCVDLINDYQCMCTNGYNGTNCEIDIDDCKSNPCMNNATCVDSIASWSCSCLPGFTGVHCEMDMNECVSNPCQRNGICIDLINGYNCQCLNDTSGKKCEIWMDNCLSMPCLNHGHCINQHGGYICDCPDQWHGDRCEYKEVNRTEDCSDLDYTECSCFVNRLRKPKKKSYTIFLGLIGALTGLLCSIIPYTTWLLLNCNTSSNKISSELNNRARNEDNNTNNEENINLQKNESDKSSSVSPLHCDCFVDHSGYDHFQRYDPKNSRFRLHKCKHKSSC